MQYTPPDRILRRCGPVSGSSMIREIDKFFFPGLGKEARGSCSLASHRSALGFFLGIYLIDCKGIVFRDNEFNRNIGLLA
jgi:hypothetical protein